MCQLQDLTPWVVCKQSHLANKSNRGPGTSPRQGAVEPVSVPVTRRNSDRHLPTRASTDGANTPSPQSIGKRHRPGSKRFVYVTSGRRSPAKTPAPDPVFKMALPPTSDVGFSTPDRYDVGPVVSIGECYRSVTKVPYCCYLLCAFIYILAEAPSDVWG